jgi:hypothetical protein
VTAQLADLNDFPASVRYHHIRQCAELRAFEILRTDWTQKLNYADRIESPVIHSFQKFNAREVHPPMNPRELLAFFAPYVPLDPDRFLTQCEQEASQIRASILLSHRRLVPPWDSDAPETFGESSIHWSIHSSDPFKLFQISRLERDALSASSRLRLPSFPTSETNQPTGPLI